MMNRAATASTVEPISASAISDTPTTAAECQSPRPLKNTISCASDWTLVGPTVVWKLKSASAPMKMMTSAAYMADTESGAMTRCGPFTPRSNLGDVALK